MQAILSVTETNPITALIPLTSAPKPEAPLIKRYSRASVGRMCQPKVSHTRATYYHKLALTYVPAYAKIFTYEMDGEVRIDEDAKIPETHIPVLQEIRQQFLRDGEHQPTEDYVIEWLKTSAVQAKLESLLNQ